VSIRANQAEKIAPQVIEGPEVAGDVNQLRVAWVWCRPCSVEPVRFDIQEPQA
jgi:hypothetical protein